MQLQDTTAIVTGGASGLGAATADALSAAGAKVHVFDLSSGPERHDRSDGVSYHDVDVADPSAVRDAVAEVAAGSSPLRVVVNCAGIGPSARLLGKAGPHDFDLRSKVVAVNPVTVSHPMAGSLGLPAVRELRWALERAEDEGAAGVLLGSVVPGSARVETAPSADQEAAAYVTDLAELLAKYP